MTATVFEPVPSPRAPHVRNAAGFLALTFTAIYLAPEISHLASLPNKFAMSRDVYFAAQQAYAGWSLFGIALTLAGAMNIWFAVWNWRAGSRETLWLALAAVALLLASLGVFFTWVEPANAATGNWTTAPLEWMAWRRQWELGHAASGVLTFAAFCCTALAALSAPPRS